MPNGADHFEQSADSDPDVTLPGTDAGEIISFLQTNAGQAYTQSEIVEATDVARNSVGPTLVRRRDSGRVDNRGNYWRISDHVQTLDQAVNHTVDVAASYEEQSFDYDEWMETAVDPREDRE